MKLKLLLLQARHPNDDVRKEERESFAQLAGLETAQIIPYDLLSGYPSLWEVRQYDGLLVGGSGDYYVSKGNLPNFTAVLHLLAEITAVGHPTFASCFGFQLLVQALGGQIEYAPEQMQVGTYELTLTENGRADELFGYLPHTFRAQLGRKDRAEELPPNVLNLAASPRAPYQALRIPGQPIWATQFHPELTKATNLARFDRYAAGYAAVLSPEEVAATRARFDHTPEANQLLARFVRLVFGQGAFSVDSTATSQSF